MKDLRKYLIALILIASSLGLAWHLFYSERRHLREVEEAGQGVLDVESDVIEARSSGEKTVVVFFYSGAAGGAGGFLSPSQRQILETGDPALTARQIVLEILKGPPQLVDAEPRVRQVFVLADGTAVVDLPSDVSGRLLGGATAELALVRSITRSLVDNVAEIKRVRILVEGQQQATLAGHVSLGSPFM